MAVIKDPARLTPTKWRAILALVQTRTIVAAAKQVGISERCLWNWLGEPVFVAALRRVETVVVENITRQLLQLGESATQLLADVIVDNEAPVSTRVAAARTVLVLLHDYRSLGDLEMRLAVIEQALAGNQVELAQLAEHQNGGPPVFGEELPVYTSRPSSAAAVVESHNNSDPLTGPVTSDEDEDDGVDEVNADDIDDDHDFAGDYDFDADEEWNHARDI